MFIIRYIHEFDKRCVPLIGGKYAYRVQVGVDDAEANAWPGLANVGEVRTGQDALLLFCAQMSDRPGLCTFHAEGAEAAVHRMSVILFADSQVSMEAAREIFAQAVDLVVQVG